MDSSRIKALFALLIGIPVAIWLGVSIAQDQAETVLWITGAAFLFLCLALGRHVWILIPATMGLSGALNFIPATPYPWILMTAVVGGFTLLRIASRRQLPKFTWTGMETGVVLVALTIAQAFLRNPTGFAVLGSELAGGKPYFVYAAAFAAYVLVATADADIKSWRIAVIAFIAGTLVDGTISALSAVYPNFARLMLAYYSNVSLDAAVSLNYYASLEDTRLDQFVAIGATLGLMASTLWRPLGALDLTKPWRGLTALTAVVLTLLSGFRSYSTRLVVYFTVGSIARRKPFDVIAIFVLGAVAVAVMTTLVPSHKLPYSVQRVLTVIPGYEARDDIEKGAEGSTELRVQMWKLALFTDRYISNKVLGDGFQLSAIENRAAQAFARRDIRTLQSMNIEDVLLANGSYHGFHAETIRFTGVVGLIAATIALITFAIYAGRNVRIFRNHPCWGYVLFISVPFLIDPFWYWLVFGAYKNGFPQLIANAGMVKLAYEIGFRRMLDTGSALPGHPDVVSSPNRNPL